MSGKSVFKIIFVNQGEVFEVFAKEITQSAMMGFIEIRGFVFGNSSTVVIDPSVEKLQNEFEGVKCTYIPMHAVIRIDEVEKEGVAKIIALDGHNKQVINFPGTERKALNKPIDDK